MSLSRLREEILIVLTHSDRGLWTDQIEKILNQGRTWKEVTKETVRDACNQMVLKGLLTKKAEGHYKKVWYSPTKLGQQTIEEMEGNRQRLKIETQKAIATEPTH